MPEELESFWFSNPRSLVTRDNWKQFVPRGSTLDVHNLNILARFILYLGIASWLYFRKQEIILITILGLLATVLIYKKFVKKATDITVYPETINSTSYERQEENLSDVESEPYPYPQVGNNSPSVNISNLNLVGVMNTATCPSNNLLTHLGNPGLDPRFELPAELFDMDQGRLNVKPVNEDNKLISKGIETNGLPNDNMPNMGAEGLPNFDLRPGSGSCNLSGGSGSSDAFDISQSLFLKNDPINDDIVNGKIRANNLTCVAAPVSAIQNAFQMGDRLGDNIRRDNNIHSASIDFAKTPNNVVCGARNPNLGIGGGLAGSPAGQMPGTCGPGCDSLGTRGLLGSIEALESLGNKTCGPCKFSTKSPCQMATPNNPFGNVLPTDNVANPGRGPSCLDRDDTDNKWTFAASPFAASFIDPNTGTGSLRTPGQGLFRNVDDVWNVNNGQMAFNTLPNTTIPNDQAAYLKFLYHVPYVCKDGDLEACYGIDEIQTRKAGQILAR